MRRPVPRTLCRPGLTLTAVAGLVLAGAGIALAPTAAARPAPTATHGHATVRSCATPATTRTASCDALKVTGISPLTTPSGLGHTELDSAYSLPANGGTGSTFAVVDAMDDPNAAADLAVYRAQYGLSACTVANGCFRKVSQTGSTTALPAADAGWAEEESQDLDLGSATAPAAHLLLVEANSATTANLGTAVNEAVALGATSIDIGWGGGESSSDTTYDSEYFNHPGVAISAPSGDDGFGVEYPAASQYVTAVGDTVLASAPGTKRGWTESAASATGGGCSSSDPKPTWQTDTFCTTKSLVDVSAGGATPSGFAVYDTYGGDPGWEVFLGSSVSASIIAGVFADAGVPSAGTRPASFPYAHPTALYDITGGPCTSVCTAAVGPGYDLPTGLGTPNGVTAFKG